MSQPEYLILKIGTGGTAGEPLFWNNSQGWVSSDLATRFSHADSCAMSLPIGGRWFATGETVGYWTVEDFRKLLTSYLTEPEFAEVGHVGADELHVSLSDGSGFVIKISTLVNREVEPFGSREEHCGS